MSRTFFWSYGDPSASGVLYGVWRLLAAVEQCTRGRMMRRAGWGQHRREPPEFGSHLSASREPCLRRMPEPSFAFGISSGSRKDIGRKPPLVFSFRLWLLHPRAECYTQWHHFQSHTYARCLDFVQQCTTWVFFCKRGFGQDAFFTLVMTELWCLVRGILSIWLG